MKKSLLALIGLATAVGLTGCFNGGTVAADDPYRGAYVQELPDGRSVICAWASYAVDCDWENAR